MVVKQMIVVVMYWLLSSISLHITGIEIISSTKLLMLIFSLSVQANCKRCEKRIILLKLIFEPPMSLITLCAMMTKKFGSLGCHSVCIRGFGKYFPKTLNSWRKINLKRNKTDEFLNEKHFYICFFVEWIINFNVDTKKKIRVQSFSF